MTWAFEKMHEKNVIHVVNCFVSKTALGEIMYDIRWLLEFERLLDLNFFYMLFDDHMSIYIINIDKL